MTESVEEPRLPSPKERRRLREAAGLTWEELAAAVGVSATTVRSWEAGRTTPRGRKRRAYAAFLTPLRDPPPRLTPDPAPAPAPPAEAAPRTAPDACPEPREADPADARTGGTPDTGPGPTPRAPYPTTPATAALPEPPADPREETAPEAEGQAGTGAEAALRAETAPGAEKAPRTAGRAGAAAGAAPRSGVAAGPPAGTEAEEGHDAGAAAEAVFAAGTWAWAGPGIAAAPPGAGTVHRADGDGAGPAQPAATGPEPAGRGPAGAFDRLHRVAAYPLLRQVYLLTGRRELAQESVERAFQQAWARWPEVASDPDPVGWVRAAAYEYALSPWHRFRRTHRHPDPPPADPAERIVLDAMLALPPAHRRTVLLYDGVGLDLPDTAAETECSTPIAGYRLLTAHAELADRIPDLAAARPEARSALLRERLGAVRPPAPPAARPAAVVRRAAEYRARGWSRAVFGLTAVIAVATAYTTVTAPRQYEPPIAPGVSVSGVPPLSGPQQLTEQSRELHDRLRADPGAGPARIAPALD